MARLYTLLALVICFALSGSHAFASTDPLDAPPPGLVATTAHLADVLKLHKVESATKITEDWAFTDTGVAGTEHLERDGDNYHSTITTGTLVEQYGQYTGSRWHQDYNGMTSSTTGTDDRSFLGIRVNEDAADPKNDARVIGSTGGDSAAYVVEIKRPHYRHPEWIYYDAHNGNITRVEWIWQKSRVIETFDDFRTVEGVTQAWHFHDAYSDKTLDDDWRITAFHTNASIADSAFAPPPSVPHAGSVTTQQQLTAHIMDDGTIVLRLNAGGRGLDFEVDSSSPESYIDRDLAAQLNLPTFGHATHLANGKPLSYTTVLPDAQLGPIELHNFAFEASDIAYNPSDGMKVVGVLGYDFFATNIVHIDYVNGTVDLLPKASFNGVVAPIDGASEIPLTLDGGVPFVPMMIGDAITNRVVLNPDILTTIVFGSYTDAHADQFKDLEPGQHHTRSVPFADEGSYGTNAEVWFSQTPTLKFAITNFQNLPILTTNFPYDTSGGDVDAMIGFDYLRFYDLYFDFPDQRFFVKPNKWFFQTFKLDHA